MPIYLQPREIHGHCAMSAQSTGSPTITSIRHNPPHIIIAYYYSLNIRYPIPQCMDKSRDIDIPVLSADPASGLRVLSSTMRSWRSILFFLISISKVLLNMRGDALIWHPRNEWPVSDRSHHPFQGEASSEVY